MTRIVMAFQKPPSSEESVEVFSPNPKERVAPVNFRRAVSTLKIIITSAETASNCGPIPTVRAATTDPIINSPKVNRTGARTAQTLSPRIPINAGSKVIPTMTATKTTIIAPSPKAWKVRSGIISIPRRAKTTVSPLNTTARPAEPLEASIACCLVRPRLRSSL